MRTAARIAPARRPPRLGRNPGRAALVFLFSAAILLQGALIAAAAGGLAGAAGTLALRADPVGHHERPSETALRLDCCVLSGSHCKGLSGPAAAEIAAVPAPTPCGSDRRTPEAAFLAAAPSRLPLGSRAPPGLPLRSD